MQKYSIRGLRFFICEESFITSPEGDLGHFEECEAFAVILQSLFEITKDKDVHQTHSLPLQAQFNEEFADRFNLKIVDSFVDEDIKDLFFPTYHFHNDPSGIEHLMIEFGRAISYSGWLSINCKRGSKGREKQGAWVYGRSKFGYKKLREYPEHPQRCSLFPIPDPKTFPARKRLVELWLNGVRDEACSIILKREFGISVKRHYSSISI